VTIETQGANGTVTVNPDGSINYAPNADFNRSDSFTYRISDGNGGSTVATVNMTVDPANDAPDAVDDNAASLQDTAVTIAVLANDTDPEGDTLSVVGTTNGTSGNVVANPDGTITYTPNPGFLGTDSFTYTIDDGNGAGDTATVTVTVAATNSAPALDLDGSGGGTGYAASFIENGAAVAIADTDVLITDADDTQMESATITLANAQAGDQLVVNLAGLPAGLAVDPSSTATNVILTGLTSLADYQIALQQVLFQNTSDTPGATSRTINVTVNDGIANSNTAVATIAIDRAPDAVGDTAATEEGVAVTTGNVLANDDQGDAPATITAFDAASAFGGTVLNNGDGTFTYTPAAGFTGADSFTYTIADSDGDTSTAAVTISVGVNGAPTGIALIVDQPFMENVAGAIAGTLSVADPNPGDTHTFSVSDTRFEVVGSQLKLKEGGRLDFEKEAQINLDVTATDIGCLSLTQSLSISVGDVSELRFAAFGDYGNGGDMQAVADLIAGMNVDFIITTGDNAYDARVSYDDQVGRSYSDYIGNYSGAYGTGSAANSFFPTLGNHDYSDGGIDAYLDYFTLPGNERYYDFQMGPIHFFALNSNFQEPDGIDSTSIQAQWLQSELASSESLYNIVYFHHAPLSSGTNGSTDIMQWPFEEWGATTVIAGHDHTYERILRDDNADGDIFPYFVTGLGGRSMYDFGPLVPGSEVQYNSDSGTMLVQVSDATVTFEFWSIAGGGTLIDSYTIDLPGADQLLAGGDDVLTGGSDSDFMNGLSGDDLLDGGGGDDMLWGGAGDDLFVFSTGDGADEIGDFTAGPGSEDVIALNDFGYMDIGDLTLDDVDGDAVIDLGGGDQITLAGLASTDLTADDFLFVSDSLIV
jgi:Ca2+-binding RTX toxin-like protein